MWDRAFAQYNRDRFVMDIAPQAKRMFDVTHSFITNLQDATGYWLGPRVLVLPFLDIHLFPLLLK